MKSQNNKDLLIGTWSGGADDGGGLQTMIDNFGIILNPDGTGISYMRNRNADEVQEEKYEIEWEYIDQGKINLRYVSGSDLDEWDTIEYEISDLIGAQDAKLFRIVEKGEDSFWDSPEPLYKSNTPVRKKGFFKRLLDKMFN